MQAFPDLLEPAYAGQSEQCTVRTEVERRATYFGLLQQRQVEKGKEIPATFEDMVKQCLHNEPVRRPEIIAVLDALKDMSVSTCNS